MQDSFRTRTRFDGLVLGLSGERAFERFSLQGSLKLNVGQITRETTILDQTTVSVPGAGTTVSQGGLLALPSNIGSHHDSNWTVIAELDLRLNYRITLRLTAFAGYHLMFWPDVARAAQQIDPVINVNQIPPPITPLTGPDRPAPVNSTSTLWIQGVTHLISDFEPLIVISHFSDTFPLCPFQFNTHVQEAECWQLAN